MNSPRFVLMAFVGLCSISTFAQLPGEPEPTALPDQAFSSAISDIHTQLGVWEQALGSLTSKKESDLSYKEGKFLDDQQSQGLSSSTKAEFAIDRLQKKRSTSQELRLVIALMSFRQTLATLVASYPEKRTPADFQTSLEDLNKRIFDLQQDVLVRVTSSEAATSK